MATVIDLGKEDVLRIRELPKLLCFDFPDGDAPRNVTATIRDKACPDGGDPLFIKHQSECAIKVMLGEDLGKRAGHGQYVIELISNCEVCQSCCVFLDYSCAVGTVRMENKPAVKKGKACE